ncbi:MAG: hypothetical protein RLZZ224_321, partial [Verrucomicrobiota bacterium]
MPAHPRNDFLMKSAPIRFLAWLSMTYCGAGIAWTQELPRELLESQCLSCHFPEKTKGQLDMSTRDSLLRGGDSGASIDLEHPKKSELLRRVQLAPDDDEIMPPTKHGKPLSAEEAQRLAAWITAGAPWPEGVVLQPADPKAMPRYDAAVDPSIQRIEAFPKSISLETKSDFHRVVVIAHFADAAMRDVTHQVKLSLADPTIAALKQNLLTPLKDGQTELVIDYRGLQQKIPISVKQAEQ